MKTGGSDNSGWNPYLAGALTGVVLALSALISGHYFGTSTTFVRTAGMIEKALTPVHAGQVEYFRSVLPKIDWQWMFVLGILIGAVISSVSSGSFRPVSLPRMWEGRFGRSVPVRAGVAFVGGGFVLFGARLAGG